MARLFIATSITPTPAMRKLWRQIDHTASRVVRTVAIGNLHLTWKFLGQTQEPRIADVSEAMRQAVTGQSGFDIEFHGLDPFPSVQRPSVVWISAKLQPTMNQLAKRVESAMQAIGFPVEDRPWAAHLTVARIKGRPPKALFDLLEGNRQTGYGPVRVGVVELIKSELHRDGAQYTSMASVELV